MFYRNKRGARKYFPEYATRVHVVCVCVCVRTDFVTIKSRTRVGFPDVYAYTIRVFHTLSAAGSSCFFIEHGFTDVFCPPRLLRPAPPPERNRIPFYSKDVYTRYIYVHMLRAHVHCASVRSGYRRRGKNTFSQESKKSVLRHSRRVSCARFALIVFQTIAFRDFVSINNVSRETPIP